MNVEGNQNRMDVPIAILWPWDFWSWMYQEGQFEQWVSDDPALAGDMCEEYWRNCEHLEFFQKINLPRNQYRTCVPLYYHTDGAKIFRNQKAWIYSFASACRKGVSTKTKLVIILQREAMIVKDESHDRIGEIIGYITDTLATGRFPLQDHNGGEFPPGSLEYHRRGQLICNGWTGRFAGFKGDWEAKAVIHKSVRFYACKYICDHCLASRDPAFTFGDFRVGKARCLSHRFSHAEYMILQGSRQSAWRLVAGWQKDRNLEETCSSNSEKECCYCCCCFIHTSRSNP